jgi:hypothetical protein
VADFAPDGAGFRMRVIEAGASAQIDTPAIALAVSGEFDIAGTAFSAPAVVALLDSEEQIRAAGVTIVASAS